MAAGQSDQSPTRELEVFAESSWLVASTLDLGEVLERLADVAQTRLGVDIVRIWLSADRAGTLTLRAETGTSGQNVEFQQRFSLGEGLAGTVLETQQPLAVPDVHEDPRVRNRTWFDAEGVRSVLLVPILLDTSPIGIIACMTRTRREFAPEEVKLAAAVAAPAATAVRNAALYAEALERLEEIQAFQRVTSETCRLPTWRPRSAASCARRTSSSAPMAPSARSWTPPARRPRRWSLTAPAPTTSRPIASCPARAWRGSSSPTGVRCGRRTTLATRGSPTIVRSTTGRAPRERAR
jgi:putative methionine-R-sulfoxide reductase with GAF domain